MAGTAGDGRDILFMTSYFFHYAVIRDILAAADAGRHKVEISLDLNLSRNPFKLDGRTLVLDHENSLDLALLAEKATVRNRVFVLENDALVPVEVRADAYVKLVPTDTVPCLEIDGVKMHRSKDIDPLTDARLKTSLVVKPGHMVLDTCGGLGYSALYALKAGAARVVSTEKSRAVIRVREFNPWLGPDQRIQLVQGDITREIRGMADGSYDSVIHDPPRFSSATGDLYGRAFYDQLFRVMKPGAGLFHYTGSPKRITQQDRFVRNAEKRLEHAGFTGLCFNQQLQGIYGLKPITRR